MSLWENRFRYAISPNVVEPINDICEDLLNILNINKVDAVPTSNGCCPFLEGLKREDNSYLPSLQTSEFLTPQALVLGLYFHVFQYQL